MIIKNTTGLRGVITIPGDKSISHRAVMFGSLANGTTEITNFLQGADCLATIDCFRKMGIEIEVSPEIIRICGKGLHGLSAPQSVLDTKNSGTTTRLISGILAGQNFETILSGDASLNTRPMGRIIEPLSLMGGRIESMRGNNCAPLRISPSLLCGIHYHSKVASAQVKSAILLAGLYADQVTSVTEPVLSRNHTELMLSGFGGKLHRFTDSATNLPTVSIEPEPNLDGQKIIVPGDISSAAYFIAAGLLVPHSEILIRNVGINPTRAGILTVCQNMGGDITFLNKKTVGGEPVADLLVRTSSLHGTVVEGSVIPTLIDEIPIIAVLAAFADGTTTIKNAEELKVKETNRIETVSKNLTKMGGDIIPTEDGMIITGKGHLSGAKIDSFLDHRIA
ncbi:MAG: 3-phosphoshikimate 1-carboxyvinyltransferase, partial [Lachnospiraceae bacterium]|nr:3-phosphoshikimate 1-carboxyvinyltransferase [Lachnospiraceae bacterium]